MKEYYWTQVYTRDNSNVCRQQSMYLHRVYRMNVWNGGCIHISACFTRIYSTPVCERLYLEAVLTFFGRITTSTVQDNLKTRVLEASWNVVAHAQKSDFVFRRNGRIHLNRRGCQFSRLLAAEVCTSAVVMLDIPCSEVVWRVLVTLYCHFLLHFPSLRHRVPSLFNWSLHATKWNTIEFL